MPKGKPYRQKKGRKAKDKKEEKMGMMKGKMKGRRPPTRRVFV